MIKQAMNIAVLVVLTICGFTLAKCLEPITVTEINTAYIDGKPSLFGNITDLSNVPQAQTYYVDANDGNDLNNGLSLETALATIQMGIDTAKNSDTVLVYPGVYAERVNFLGKSIKVQGVAGPAGVPVLESLSDFAVSFYYGEDPNSILQNFVLTNNLTAILIIDSSPTIKNVTFVNNNYGIVSFEPSDPNISNSIFWNNAEGDLIQCQARYSCLEEISQGQGNISEDPLFADPNNGDFHLLSQWGRYWPQEDTWVLDDVTSPCIDSGDPNDAPSDEPIPNGGRINMGAYGGTAYASMSETQ